LHQLASMSFARRARVIRAIRVPKSFAHVYALMEYQTIETLIKGIKIYKLKMENIPEYCSFSSAQDDPIVLYNEHAFTSINKPEYGESLKRRSKANERF
jgi:hypothetical protein